MLLSCLSGRGQYWSGFETGRFSGISSANSRPASMAIPPFQVDVTLAGMHVFTPAENLFQKDAADVIFSGGLKNLAGFSRHNQSKSLVISNLQLPSVLCPVKQKVSVAFSWNLRYMWLSEFSEPRVARLFDRETYELNLSGNNETVSAALVSWNEFGLGAAGELWNKTYHTLYGGGFAKLVFGHAGMMMHLDNLHIRASGTMVESIRFRIRSVLSGKANDLVDDGKPGFFGKAGYGFDMGLEYRWQNPRVCPGAANHRIRTGIALNDIGQMRFDSGTKYQKADAGTSEIGLQHFRNATGLSVAVDTLQKIFDIPGSATGTYKITLPMSLRIYTDFNLNHGIYVFTEFHWMFAGLMDKDLTPPLLFRYNLTPRFEDYRFGVYLPLTFGNIIPANAGFALRWKPLIVGSGNLLTFWAYDDTESTIDLFMAIKIPVAKMEERIDYKKQRSFKRR